MEGHSTILELAVTEKTRPPRVCSLKPGCCRIKQVLRVPLFRANVTCMFRYFVFEHTLSLFLDFSNNYNCFVCLFWHKSMAGTWHTHTHARARACVQTCTYTQTQIYTHSCTHTHHTHITHTHITHTHTSHTHTTHTHITHTHHTHITHTSHTHTHTQEHRFDRKLKEENFSATALKQFRLTGKSFR